MQTAREHFSEVLAGIRNLSYAITPPTTHWVAAEELVKEYIEKISSTFSFDLRFKINSKKNTSTGDKAIVAIRVIEQWLKVLGEKKDVSKVNITVQTTTHFEVLIEDNGTLNGFETMRKEVFESTTFDMAQSQGGRIDISISKLGKNLFTLVLPVAAVAVT
jgi:signal transduction histidine kinase